MYKLWKEHRREEQRSKSLLQVNIKLGICYA